MIMAPRIAWPPMRDVSNRVTPAPAMLASGFRSRDRLPARRTETTAAVVSSEATLASLGLNDFEYTATAGGNTARITMDASTLVRLLTTRVSYEQRVEWARHIVLEAQERLPGAPLRNLWTSVGRESWELHCRRHSQQAARAGGAMAARGADGAPLDGAMAERETLATEINQLVWSLTSQMRKLGVSGGLVGPPDKVAGANRPADVGALVEAAAFTPDVLRAAPHTSSLPTAGEAVASGAWIHEEGFVRDATSDRAVLFCTPAWAETGGGERMQAVMNFSPGVGHGDSVLVMGPDGEQRELQIPPGLMNVQRVLASLPSVVGRGRADPAAASPLPLRVDITPLSPTAAPGDSLLVGGVELTLPSYAAPATSLVVALPVRDAGTTASLAAQTAGRQAGAGRQRSPTRSAASAKLGGVARSVGKVPLAAARPSAAASPFAAQCAGALSAELAARPISRPISPRPQPRPQPRPTCSCAAQGHAPPISSAAPAISSAAPTSSAGTASPRSAVPSAVATRPVPSTSAASATSPEIATSPSPPERTGVARSVASVPTVAFGGQAAAAGVARAPTPRQTASTRLVASPLPEVPPEVPPEQTSRSHSRRTRSRSRELDGSHSHSQLDDEPLDWTAESRDLSISPMTESGEFLASEEFIVASQSASVRD